MYPIPNKQIIKTKTIRRRYEQVQKEHDKVSMIIMADAASGKNTMVVPL